MPSKIVGFADLTERRTGCKVSVPVDATSKKLVEQFAYWRAYYFRLGSGFPQQLIHERHLKKATMDDYSLVFVKSKAVR